MSWSGRVATAWMYTHAFTSGALGALNDDVETVTGRPPISFAEFAVGAAAAWRP